jgi:hypothetical protein
VKTATQRAASRTGPGCGDGVLVDPGWLAGHLNDADLRVVEVDVSPTAYDDWHIDGAVLWDVYTDLKEAGYRTVGPAALERLAATALGRRKLVWVPRSTWSATRVSGSPNCGLCAPAHYALA